MVVMALGVFNAGLLLVDHMHFQYNGLLLGLLILCLDCANRNQHLMLTVYFSILVLMKHLFVPLATVFGVYLLATHCYINRSSSKSNPVYTFSIFRLLQVVLIAIVALLVCFGPFIYYANESQYFSFSQSAMDITASSSTTSSSLEIPIEPFLVLGHQIPSQYLHQTTQILRILSQLFPFGRGLVHAYWAPNVWALYCVADKMLTWIVQKYFGELSMSVSVSMIRIRRWRMI